MPKMIPNKLETDRMWVGEQMSINLLHFKRFDSLRNDMAITFIDDIQTQPFHSYTLNVSERIYVCFYLNPR